jgi:biopolymer transport protein ExbB
MPLAMVCFGIWFFFLRTRRRFLQETADASHVMGAIRQRNWDRIRQMPGNVAELLRESLNGTLEDRNIAAAFDEGSGRFVRLLRRDIVVLAALTTVAPLLGLLGTVMGMIETFDAVSATSGETATRVASGVSRALITTQVGLVIAIPGFFGLARLRRLCHHLQTQLGALKLHAILLEERI